VDGGGPSRKPGLTSPGPHAGAPLSILQIYPKGDFYTGAAIQLRDLARGLARRGHRVTVVTRPSERWAAEGREAGFTHLGLFRSPVDPAGAVRLAARFRTEGTQLVHAHKGGGRTLVLLARLLGPRPPLIVNRGVSFPLSLAGRLLDGSRLVARIVAVCQAIKADLIRQGIPPEKIEVVYSGTDTERFDPTRAEAPRIRAELGLAPGIPLLTQIGVREPKGNDDVLRAFGRVRLARANARLLLVGARAETRRPVEDLAATLGVGGAVTIWGYRDDVPDILAASEVSVDASHVGLGITGSLRESLAMETPVVAASAMGNPELVKDGETGLLVPPRDPEAMASAILRLLADPAWAKALGRAGRRRVAADFSTRAKIEQIEALYARVTGRV
jgi:glycosyltransferase involved in cell wall biosynthesis